MKIFLALFFLFFLSCDDQHADPQFDNQTELQKKDLEFVWICHHPDTQYHNEVCVEKEYPDGCYVSGDRTKFCWILNKDDCSGKLLKDWQVINCSHLKGR